MPLGTEVGFGPGGILLDGDAGPTRREGVQQSPATFRPIVAKRSLISAAVVQTVAQNRYIS